MCHRISGLQGPDLHIHHSDDVLASMNEWSEVRCTAHVARSCVCQTIHEADAIPKLYAVNTSLNHVCQASLACRKLMVKAV